MSLKSKRYGFAISLLLVMSLVLGACGGGNTGAGNSGSQNPAEKPVELIWYTIGSPQKDTDRVMAEVSKYTKEKINATVKMIQVDWGDYTQKLQVMSASGEPMDIAFTSSWAFDYVQNARKGAFLPIDDLLKEHGQGIVDTLDPAFLEGSKVDGKNYGVPANKELPAQEVWRFNKQYLDKHNLDITGVNSLESLEPILAGIKAKEPNVTPLLVDKNFRPYIPYDFVIENLPMAVALDTTDYKVVNMLETAELKQALETMHKYYKAGYIPAEAATMGSATDIQTAGTWLVDRANTQPFADNLWSESLGYPIVSVPASDPIIYNWSVMGSMQAISANSEYPEKAMQFLNLLNTDEYLRNLVDSGIEGVHYEKLSDNVMQNLEESKNYDMPTFSLGNVMLTYLNPTDPENKWEEFEKFNASGEPAPLLGFNFDTSKVSTELATVLNVKEEFWSALMTGTVDPNELLPKAIEKFKAAGLDKIIEEAQRQVDEWRAANSK